MMWTEILAGFISGIIGVTLCMVAMWVWDRFIWPAIVDIIWRRRERASIEENLRELFRQHMEDHKRVFDESGNGSEVDLDAHIEAHREFLDRMWTYK
jgi:hypothetical protein